MCPARMVMVNVFFVLIGLVGEPAFCYGQEVKNQEYKKPPAKNSLAEKYDKESTKIIRDLVFYDNDAYDAKKDLAVKARLMNFIEILFFASDEAEELSK